ncbi:Glycogen debranching enzyme [Neolecta irregularis DAH-3]|uniref:Glycogen debranching enzyme n=1 Tax=Neolecta irregularis (strain DAH-3) TaxID=1198029 RepID=A0A1U7LJN6_NEOID|nr:Glycogen debranching enzyme [Neolecta irregularis DAH-3]|eukprot:OLL22762.1 Glycogen debranching enzyme [Neolecta irregularis DAH-3]
MVHFTPLQERGESNSPYSIYNQLSFSPDLFEEGTPREERVKKVKDLVTRMEHMGLLAMTDVVWNHTANNSDWLLDHPEAGYNLVNSPHLRAAYELDTALLSFGHDLNKLGLPTVLKDIEDLNKIMNGVKEHVLKPLKLWQFYVIDTEYNLKVALDTYNEKIQPLEGWNKSMSSKEAAILLKSRGLRNGEVLGNRFQKNIDPATGAAYMRCFSKEAAEEETCERL